jgi:hypothetical protein
MITIVPVRTLEQLVEVTPLLIEGYHSMNKRKKVFEVDVDGFIKTLVGILNTTPQNGLFVALDGDEAVGYGAAFDDTPAFAQKKELLLWALYVKPQYPGTVVAMLFDAAKQAAKEQGYEVMKAFNSRFTGGMYRLFEDKLGMRRHRIQFNITL